MREEQQKDRDNGRVTRRGGTKMFGGSTAPREAERIRAFDDERDRAPRNRGYDDDRERRRYRDDDDRDYRESRRYRDDDDRDYRESRRYRDDDDRDYRESRRYRDDDDRDYRESRRYRDEDDRDYRESRRYQGDRSGGSDHSRERERGKSAREPRGTDKPRTAKPKTPARTSTVDTELFAHQVVPYVMFWVALFAAVSFILRDIAGLSASAGAFGNWLADFLCGLFGIGAYVLPLFLLVLSLRWKRFVREGILGKKLFLSTSFLLLLSGIIHVFQDPDRARRIVSPAILYAEGVAKGGGGFFGGFVGEWLGFCLRLPGTCLLAIPLLIIIGIYLVGLTPSGLWQRIDAKLKMMRQRGREQRGANGARVAPPATREGLPKGEEQKGPAWKEPRPLSRSGVTYDFREDEPEIAVADAPEKSERKASSAPTPAARTQDPTRARRAAEVNEILDIPDDEPLIDEPSPEARGILSRAGHGDDAGRQVEDILREMERAAAPEATVAKASTVAATAPEPPKAEAGDYYAPFALPVRPEPVRNRVVNVPQAKDTSDVAVPAVEAEVQAPVTEESEECLGSQRATPYVPQAATLFVPAREAAEPTVAVKREPEPFLSWDSIPAEPETVAENEPEAAEEAFATATPATADNAGDLLADLFEDEEAGDGQKEDVTPAAPSYTPPARTAFGFDVPADFSEDDGEDEAPDMAMPASGVAAVYEQVDPAPTPVFTPAFSTPAAQTPPRRVPVETVTPVKDEPPIPPVPVRKEYVKPPLSLLNEDKNVRNDDFYEEIEETKQILRDTLESFNIHIQDEVAYSHGPSVTRYELRPVAGTSVRSVTNRIEDISLNLASLVRIEAPIPGKPAIGIEVPNKVRETVYMRTMLESEEFKRSTDPLEVPLGLDVGGEVKMCNLAKMPHLLIAGTTGSGKSVCINSILVSLIYKTSPEDLRLILIDPKQIEFAPYEHVPHLYMPIVTDMQRAAGALACAVQEMERRFSLIRDVGVRNIEAYNEAVKNDPDREHLPYMVIVIDEFADLKMSCSNNDPENFTCRIAQKARAAGIHLIIGTQRPSVDVITGKLKTNIPSRIAFMVKQQVDSRTILDANGAESLTGRGDMLYMPSNSSDKAPNRVQGAFVSDGELERVISFVRKNNDPVQYNQAFMDQIEIEMAKSQNGGKKNDLDDFADEGDGNEDPKFVEAVKLAVETQKVATSLLQRRLGVGYGRAAKIIDRMEELGLVSSPDGNKPRQILPAAQGYLNHIAADDEGGSDDFNEYQ